MNSQAFIIAGLLLAGTGWGQNKQVVDKTDYKLVINKDGRTLGYSPSSRVKIIQDKGSSFKDLNKNGKLDVYEDWRLSVDDRAKDLAGKMSVEQIAGLMLYSRGESIPASHLNYRGKSYPKSGANPWDVHDIQIDNLKKNNLRHMLFRKIESPIVAAKWNNSVQALTESLPLGIPANNSSDPRHTQYDKKKLDEYIIGACGEISKWPRSMGIAATFDPEVMKKFGEIASLEYRALGMTTALSPQVDLGTEPRWNRMANTFGEDPDLTTDMARAYIDGFQSTADATHLADGWGYDSVNCMVKHWPGGGTGEAGRDAHFGYGAFGVFPGNNIKDHMKPFLEGAFKLDGKTGKASAVMPYYTVSYNQDVKYGENVANGFSTYLIKDLLRNKYNYDGVLCTDWRITDDHNKENLNRMAGKSWGVETLSEDERYYKAIIAGMDQFGGVTRNAPIVNAYNMGVKEYGEEFMRKRFEKSAVRLLKNIFRVGLFENPYLDPAESEKVVGNIEFIKAGYEAQVRSILMLKNRKNILPLKEKKVYIPAQCKIKDELSDKYFKRVQSPAEADVALVFIGAPNSGKGYSHEDLKKGGNGYLPISRQYGSYTAEHAREQSISHGMDIDGLKNRSYNGKTTRVSNWKDARLVTDTEKQMGNKPVIVIIDVNIPMVFSEIEPSADAIITHFGVLDQAIFDVISGKSEPNALLPFQMPANMATVEKQLEDVPRDMECHVDTEGNIYDFAFGMNWKGVIKDSRVKKYK